MTDLESRRFYLDRRAGDLADKAAVGDADELLNTSATSELLGVSTQWLEIGRSKGYGPPFLKLGPTIVRYRRGDLRKWCAGRQQLRTSPRPPRRRRA